MIRVLNSEQDRINHSIAHLINQFHVNFPSHVNNVRMIQAWWLWLLQLIDNQFLNLLWLFCRGRWFRLLSVSPVYFPECRDSTINVRKYINKRQRWVLSLVRLDLSTQCYSTLNWITCRGVTDELTCFSPSVDVCIVNQCIVAPQQIE